MVSLLHRPCAEDSRSLMNGLHVSRYLGATRLLVSAKCHPVVYITAFNVGKTQSFPHMYSSCGLLNQLIRDSKTVVLP